MKKKVIAVDFDGVLHSFASGWIDTDIIPDPPVYGAIEWLMNLIEDGYEVVIFSCRCESQSGIGAIVHWLIKHRFKGELLPCITFTCKKPACHILIDDRVICFRGTLPSRTEINNFKPWHGQSVWGDSDE